MIDLNHVMEFDHVIEVHADGTITEPQGVRAPEMCNHRLDSPDWELMNGYSRQEGYGGPIMHPSELIGGVLADDIMSTPGLYVAIVSYGDTDDDAAGWAIAYRPTKGN